MAPFSRTHLFFWKFNIAGIAILLTQWLRKKDCAEYFADLSQLTLSCKVWCKRLYASIVDGEKTLAVARGMSNAHAQLGHLYQIAAAPGWLDDESRESFAELALELAAFDLLKLKGEGVRSVGGSALRSVPAKLRSVTSSRRSCASSRRTGHKCTSAPTACRPTTCRGRRSTPRRSRCSRTASRWATPTCADAFVRVASKRCAFST